jgi:hypothetical protein
MLIWMPRPRVAEPDRRQHVNRCRFGSAICHRDLDQDVLAIAFRIRHDDVEVAIAVEDAGVDELELWIATAPAAVLVDQLRVGERRVRVAVEIAHEGMRRRAVQMEVVLLDVFAVVAFVAVQAKEPLLQDRIPAVPERERKADPLMAVGNAGEAIFVPAVGARARVVVRERVPHRAAGAVVLADGAPGAFAQVGAPALPVLGARPGLFEPQLFSRYHHALLDAGGPTR